LKVVWFNGLVFTYLDNSRSHALELVLSLSEVAWKVANYF